MLPHFSPRVKSSLEPLEARIAPAGLQNFDAGVVAQFEQAPVDLALTKTADVASAAPGDTITYTFHVSNAGSTDATGVTVSDPVVAGLNFVATENPGWSLNQAHTAYVHDYGSLAASAQGVDFTLKLHVSPTVAADVTTLTNAATVSDDLTHGADANPNDNTSSAPVTINADATLHLALRSESAELAHGAKVTYTLIYSNTGNRDAHVILTEQPINHSATFLSDNPGWTYNASGNVYEYDAGTLLARSGNHSVPYVVQADALIPTTVAKLTNSASIDYAPPATEGNVSDDTHPSLDTPVYQGIYVLSPGTTTLGHYALPKVQVFDITTGKRTDIQVYPSVVRDSIRTSLGDFNNDGFDDILVTTEHGLGATEIFDGATGKLMASPFNNLQPFGKNKGSFVAVGEFGFSRSVGTFAEPPIGPILIPSSPEVVFGSSLGGGAVKIFVAQSQVEGQSLVAQQVRATFYPFGPKFTGGVRVAIGDVNGDGRDDLVVAQGNFGNLVNVYNGGDPGALLASFPVGPAKFKGGLNLAVGDIDHDGVAEIVTGRNRLSAPTVETFDYVPPVTTGLGTATLKASFNAFGATYPNGVRVALADTNHDGILDIIATTGFAGHSQVKIFSGALYGGKTLAANAIQLQGPAPATVIQVITAVPPLLKSFTAIPSNLDQAIWASATTVVPHLPAPFIGIEFPLPFPLPPFTFIPNT